MRIARGLGWILVLALGAAASEARAVSPAPAGAVVRTIQIVPTGGAAPRRAELWSRRGTVFVSVNDLCVLLDGVKYWRSDLGRLQLEAGPHRFTVTEGSDLAVVDKDQLVHMSGAAFLWDGALYVPLDLVVDETGTAQSWIPPAVRWNDTASELSAAPRPASVTEARIVDETQGNPAGWRLRLTADRDFRVDVVRTEPASIVLRIPGITYDPLLLPLPTDHEVFRALELRTGAAGLEIACSPGPDVRGYLLVRPAPDQMELFLGVDAQDVESGLLRPLVAPRGLVPDHVRRVVLDPGHGASDLGAALDGGTEAALTYDVCRRASERIRSDLRLEVVLTRGEGEDAGERGGLAANPEEDLFISVHMHGGRPAVRGYVAAPVTGTAEPSPVLTSLGFRAPGDATAASAAASRLLARVILRAVATTLSVDMGGVQAAEVRELYGAAGPAVLLEVCRGKAPWDESVRDALASALVDGIRIYLAAGEGEW